MRIPKRVNQAPRVEQVRTNFCIIHTSHGRYYQSYSSIVAYWDFEKGMWFFGPNHDYSATTNRHLKQAIGLSAQERNDMIQNKQAGYSENM